MGALDDGLVVPDLDVVDHTVKLPVTGGTGAFADHKDWRGVNL